MKRKLLNALALGVFGVMGITTLASCNDTTKEVATYTVVFYTNGGSAIADKSVQEGNRIAGFASLTPTKENYYFEGWYTDSALTNVFGETSIVTGNITLYAKWTETITITFNSNGGSAVASKKVKKGTSANSIEEAPTKAGCAFNGWYLDQALTNPLLSTAKFEANTTLFASWIDNMSYTDFMAAEAGDAVVVSGFIAAKQSWWNDSAVMYLIDEVGTGYFCYGVKCTQAEYNTTYTIGTYVKLVGEKAIYAEEHEINSGATATVVQTTKTMPTVAYDISNIIGNNTELMKHQNSYFTATLTVKAYGDTNKAYAFAASDATVEAPKGDLYFTLTDGTKTLDCCVESYLTSESSDVYKAVMALEVGQTVAVEGYLYWWNGANPHITSISVVDESAEHKAFVQAEDGADVTIHGFIGAKQAWWNNSAVFYLVDSTGYGYFCYGAVCSQEEYNNVYTVGTYVTITGSKTSYAGQLEINSNATIATATTTKTMPTTPVSISNLLGSDSLINYQSAYFTATLTVKAYGDTNKAYAFAASDATVEAPKGDLYFTLTDGTKILDCCVESYLTSESSAVYKTVMALEVGQTVTVTGYLYWWNGANPHITSITVC